MNESSLPAPVSSGEALHAYPVQTLLLARAPGWIRQRPWLQRLLIRVTGVNINAKIMGIVVALTILFGLVVTIQVRLIMVMALQSELHNQGFSFANDLADRASPLLRAGDTPEITAALASTLRNHPDSRYAFVLDTERTVVASAARSAEGEVTTGVTIPDIVRAADLIYANARHDHLHYAGPEGRVHDFVIPIHNENEDEIGLVRLALVEARLGELISDVTDQLWLTTLIAAGIGILAATTLTWLITRPVLDLVTATDQVRQGDLTARAPRWSDDEIGALADTFNQMISELEVSQQMVIEKESARTHLLSRLISAQEEERKRIARELHDGVGQALTSILVHIKVLAQDQDAANAARLGELRKLVDETLVDVRLLSRELRPSALDDLGLAAALERYIAEFAVRYPHLSSDLHCTLARRLPPNVETSLYRIIQEAMTNAARHSHATNVSILVNERAGAVHAIIEDNGTGFAVDEMRRIGGSVGLHSMSERAELLNGTLEIESSDDGTTIFVQIPLTEVQEQEVQEQEV